MSSIASISKVTRDLSARSSGSAHVSTRRLGGLLSKTFPVIQTSRFSSPPMCCHGEPFFQSETFSTPAQYWRVNSGLVMAAHSFFGVVRMNVVSTCLGFCMSSAFLVFGFFETLFQIAQRLKTMAFVFGNPALGDLVNRHWIEIMQLLAPAPDDDDKVCRLQQEEMLRHRLPRHVEVFTQLAERLPVALVQLVEQLSAAFVRQGLEHGIHLGSHYATIWLHVKLHISVIQITPALAKQGSDWP